MKKTFLLVLVVLFFIITENVFAEGSAEDIKNAPGLKAVEKTITNRQETLLAQGYNDGNVYVLTKDANGTLYLYEIYIGISHTYDGSIRLYKEDGKTDKESIKKEVDKGNKVTKIIDAESYSSFKVDGWPDKFYVKTPKGNFYSVNKLIRKAENAGSFTGIDDFLN